MNKSLFFVLVLVSFFCCKEKEREDIIPIKYELVDKKKDSVLKKVTNKIDFNSPPISIKEYTLNEDEFWVTSSMIDAKYLDTIFCSYKDYHFLRGYDILSRKNDEVVNQLEVYVKDDVNKWNREKASEEFSSIEIKDKSIKVWGKIYIGMSKDLLVNYVRNNEYHQDSGLLVVYSKEFTSNFYFENNAVTKIKVSRNCYVDRQKQLFKNTNLDSIYKLSHKISSNYLEADFNGDGELDIVYLIEEIKSKKIGLVFFHDEESYFIIGAGIMFNSRWDNMNWLDFLDLDYQKEQYKSLFDEETFDIIGEEKVIIPNIGISIREEEGSGGLLYFQNGQY